VRRKRRVLLEAQDTIDLEERSLFQSYANATVTVVRKIISRRRNYGFVYRRKRISFYPGL